MRLFEDDGTSSSLMVQFGEMFSSKLSRFCYKNYFIPNFVDEHKFNFLCIVQLYLETVAFICNSQMGNIPNKHTHTTTLEKHGNWNIQMQSQVAVTATTTKVSDIEHKSASKKFWKLVWLIYLIRWKGKATIITTTTATWWRYQTSWKVDRV